jgi:HEAT repeat protein
VPYLIQQVQTHGDWGAYQALEYLKALTPEVAVPALMVLLERATPRTYPSRDTLLDRLRGFAPHAKQALPRLWEWLDPKFLNGLQEFLLREDELPLDWLEESGNVRFKIHLAQTIWAIEPDGRILEMLASLALTDHDDGVRTALCHAWYHIGPPAKEAIVVGYLIGILQSTNSYDDAWMATDALVSISWVPDETIDILVDMLRKHHLAGWAARVLKAVGPVRIGPVIDALRRDNKLAQEFAADVLGSYGLAAKEAAPILRERLGSTQDDVRIWSAIALAKIEPGAEIVPILVNTVETSENRTTRSMAIQALGACGKLASPAIPCLEKACDDEHAEVSEPAKAVLAALQAAE